MSEGLEPKQYVIAHVREALAEEPGLGELHVDVTVVGSKILLAGVVATEERRRLLAEVVGKLLPDYEVHNETEVERLVEAREAERLS
jgi:osmotically-inducible protein OsmY